jgi:acyl carrier protein
MLSAVELDKIIHDTVRTVAARASIELGALSPSMGLVDEIGLSSLNFARIIAMLEMKTGLDPFRALVSVTDIRTLGDLSRAYGLAAQAEAGAAPLDLGD